MADSTLRLVAVGCGRVFARYHLAAIRATRGVSLVGACDVDSARRQWAAQELPGVERFESLAAALAAADADAALVATPPEHHASAVEACLARGWAVLVEKPMAVSLDEARRVLAAGRRSGLPLQVGFNRRFRPPYAALRAHAAHGLREVDYTFFADAGRWDPGAAEDAPAAVLHDVGSHALDLVSWVADRPLVRVRAASRPQDAASGLIDIEARLAGGVTARCHVGHASRYEERLALTDAGGRRRAARISGGAALERARAAWDLARRKLSRRPTPADESFRAQLAAFAAACRGAEAGARADARAGFAAVAAVAACRESLALGGAWCQIAGELPAGTGADE